VVAREAARRWHGVPILVLSVASGIVDLMSSKAARLRPRQVARHKKEKRLRNSGRVPQHTLTERRREAAERQRARAADQRRNARIRRAVVPALVPLGAASFIFLAPAGLSAGHYAYQFLSADEPAWPSNPDLPHLPEPDMAFYTPSVVAGTAQTSVLVGPMPSEPWDGSERDGRYGPSIFGD
jgi:hypothetical protein